MKWNWITKRYIHRKAYAYVWYPAKVTILFKYNSNKNDACSPITKLFAFRNSDFGWQWNHFRFFQFEHNFETFKWYVNSSGYPQLPGLHFSIHFYHICTGYGWPEKQLKPICKKYLKRHRKMSWLFHPIRNLFKCKLEKVYKKRVSRVVAKLFHVMHFNLTLNGARFSKKLWYLRWKRFLTSGISIIRIIIESRSRFDDILYISLAG